MATELKGRKVRELIGPVTIKNRIRKNQKKAFWVGAFYWLATLILFVLSIFPMVGEFVGYSADESVWVLTFIDPLMAFINGVSNLTGMKKEVFNNGLVSIFYILLLLTSVWCFVGSTLHLFKIRKKNPTTKWGYNRATAAMKAMARHYGCLLAAIVMNAVTIIFISDATFTLFFYIVLVVGLFFHIVLNLASATISYFQSSEDRFRPIEHKRKLGYAMYFFRNMLQIALVFLLVLLLDKFGCVLDAPYYLVSGKTPEDGMTVVVLLILMLLWLCVCGLIRYVFSTITYNEYGLKLRRPFPAFLFIRRWVFWFSYKDVNLLGIIVGLNAVIAAAGQFMVMSGKITPKWVLLAVAAILLQWLFADVMFKALEKNKIRKEKTKRLDHMDPKADRDDFDQFIDEEFKLIQEKSFYPTPVLPRAPTSHVVHVGDTSEPVKSEKVKPAKAEKVKSEPAPAPVPAPTPAPITTKPVDTVDAPTPAPVFDKKKAKEDKKAAKAKTKADKKDAKLAAKKAKADAKVAKSEAKTAKRAAKLKAKEEKEIKKWERRFGREYDRVADPVGLISSSTDTAYPTPDYTAPDTASSDVEEVETVAPVAPVAPVTPVAPVAPVATSTVAPAPTVTSETKAPARDAYGVGAPHSPSGYYGVPGGYPYGYAPMPGYGAPWGGMYGGATVPHPEESGAPVIEAPEVVAALVEDGEAVAAPAEIVEEVPVEETAPVVFDDGLTDEEREERRRLKEKWIRMADPDAPAPAPVEPKKNPSPVAPMGFTGYMPTEPMASVPKVDVPEEEIGGVKGKWMRFANVDIDFDEKDAAPEFIEEQIVNCPGCSRKLSVKFGTDVAKCPACSAMFVLKKVTKEVPVEPEAPATEEEGESLTEEELYLREAEEELRRMIEEA